MSSYLLQTALSMPQSHIGDCSEVQATVMPGNTTIVTSSADYSLKLQFNLWVFTLQLYGSTQYKYKKTGHQTLQRDTEVSTQCLSVVLVVFLSPKDFHNKMIIASFKCNCADFLFSFVPLTQTRTFQTMQQQSTILVEFPAFKHAATIHQPHKTHGITFTSSLKAVFPFPQFSPNHFSCSFGMFFV